MIQLMELDRRSMLGRMLQLTGAAAMGGFSGEALAKAVASGKRYLDTPAFELLSAVADTIVPRTDTPGALEAKVPAKLDAMLATWAAGEQRFELSQALLTIERIAQAQLSQGFAALSADQRKTFLTAYDLAALKIVPRATKLSSMETMLAAPSYADPGYGKLKELIVLLYYYSEEALSSELTYEHVPGNWTPSIPITPETRPSGGFELF
jgi:gluconate 2-dehydrogenase gamma chain